mmetsp:Transcript_310/g.625  ORF Transcript_310/g.625 Transcript_310/m.625 type:complete len:827 (+) Transcript_310:181-2661(+)|eukprot:CAMPEP_0172304884 /NCGR_PEP_ID=MMETSP1058-20130122/6249_1 /TAXON_ID=83371 /ORGANISM="Detonula confervacea, Strain CCMP 353" /LENGTH=826 /DNA_ID=CAMNT_0013016291 /DNA_START=123 /DNA_END=2603 /DNA_ORIENTATION=+
MASMISRREISLARSPRTAVEDDDMSPHLNTLTNKMNIKGGVDCGHEDSTPIIESQAQRRDKDVQEQVSGAYVAESGEIHDVADTSRYDEPPGCLPAHLYESTEQGSRETPSDGNEEKSPKPPLSSSTRLQSDNAKDGQDGQVTPTATGYIQRRMPSSSIPHLLSTSKSTAADAAQLFKEQLDFVAIGSALTPSIRSKDESFAFSVDGDDSVFRKESTSPQVNSTAYPQAHLVMNLKQGTPPLEGCLSNLSSSISLASYTSPSHNIQFNITPPCPPSFAATPPHIVPITANMQGLKIGLDVPHLNQSPRSAVTPDNVSQNPANAEVGKVQSTVRSGAGPPCRLPLPNQPLPPSYQSKRNPKQSAIQPVLYSAINSLERYNAGSFENNVMIAKARGHGTEKAFPGVPNKKTDQSPSGNNSRDGLGSLVDSVVESNAVVSALAGRKSSRGSCVDRVDRKKQTGSVMFGQMGVEQLVPLSNQPSESRLYKSKSSGNLDEKDREGRPVSLEELKAKRKSSRSVASHDQRATSRRGRRREKQVGVFRPSSDAYTPRVGNRAIKYKPAKERASVEKMSSTMGTIQRPNFRDALRRVAIILHQHIVKIEQRFATGIRGVDDTGLFKVSMRDQFNEDNFATPRYKCSMVRVPMARPGVVYSMRKIKVVHNTPTTDEIYEFAHQLFKKVQLSSECSIVCLIYVEKLMEVAKVPLVSETWRPIFMAGLLLASKVWQDLSSWNIEFASVYPQYSLDAINRLELSFLKFIKWDLYISSSLYAKYYFALRSLLEKSGFRNRYNEMVGGIGGIAAAEAMKVSKRSEAVKEEALLQLSSSM